MKKAGIIASLFSLMIIFSACSSVGKDADDIYDKIHSNFYDIKSYTALCDVKCITSGGETTSRMELRYDKEKNIHSIISDEMTIEISDEETVVSKGDASVETKSQTTDMVYFPETFFKSYYESESTSVSVMAENDAKSILLECDAVNCAPHISYMKMWIDKESAAAQKLQVFDKEGNMHTEVIYKEFKFNNV